MTMKYWHRLIFLLLAVLLAPSFVTAAIRVEHYAKKDGLAGTVVSDILHDSRGYIWIGTWEGLSRFDGKQFVNYSEGDATSIPYMHNRVMRVYEDALGNVWVMMYDDRLFRLNRLTDRFDRMADVFPDFQNVRMYNPLFTDGGDVWAEVRGTGAIHFTADSVTNELSAEMVPMIGLAVNFLYEDNHATVWAATDKRLAVLRSDSLRFNTLAEHHDIRAVAEHGDKVIWGTADGSIIEYDYKTGRNKIVPLLQNVPVTSLSISPDGKSLYIGTARAGLYRYDMPDGRLSQIFGTPSDVDRLFTDSHGLVWIITRMPGVMMYDPVTHELSTFTQKVTPSSYEPAPDIVEHDGDVWVAMTGGGFGKYDRATKRLDYFHNDPSKPGDMSNVVLQFAVTSPDVVWLSTHQRGIDRVTSVDNRVSHTWIKDSPSSLVDNEVKSFFLDGDTTVLIGTKAGYLYRYSASGRLLGSIYSDASGEPIGRVYSMCGDGDGDIWLGTRGDGILRMTRDDGGEWQVTSRFRHSPTDRFSISSNEVQSIITDRFGRMWVGTYGGGVNLAVRDASTGNVRFISPSNTMKDYPMASCGKVRSLAAQSDGTVWAGTTEGLVAITYDEATKEVKTRVYRHDGDNPASLSADDIVTVYVDSRDALWVGTMAGGLNRFEGMVAGKPKFTVYSTANGLPSNHIKSIVEDKSGNLWIATDENIVMFNHETQAFSVYLEDAEPENTIFSENAAIVLPSGDPLFGANNGCYRVDTFRGSAWAAGDLRLAITDVSIDGKDTSPRVNPGMTVYIPESGVVTLPSRRSSLTVTVNALNYSLQNRVRYRYMIEGSDSTWISCGTENRFTISDLPFGENTIVIRAMLSDDPAKWEECRLCVIVPRAWWASWWFWLLVVAVVAGGVLLVMRLRSIRRQSVESAVQQHHPPRRIISLEPGKIELGDDEDEKFVTNLLAWMEANYSNPDMKIDNMVTSSGLGRTSFYNKLKTLANTSPVEFVIDFRMKKAKMFIESTNKTIAEIAYLTGYIDPHYFTRAFKTRYGETPTQYRKRYSGGKDTGSEEGGDDDE